MLTRYTITLSQSGRAKYRPEWAYRIYSALMELVPADFAEVVHEDAVTPVSQFLDCSHGELTWRVHLIGSNAESVLSPILEQTSSYPLEKDNVTLSVLHIAKDTIPDADTLLMMAEGHAQEHRLRFCTATAFKSKGRYVNLPSTRLILQSLLKKWNGSIQDCPIEDEDGEGLETLALGLRCKHFSLSDRLYYLKGNSIPGFVGEITLDNRLSGFQQTLANALLLFAGYSGVGIKTTLGMGGVITES